jgi:hypothetical protein
MMKTFGQTRIELQLDTAQALQVSEHNKRVKENRQILKDLVDATCFLARQELPFRGNDESRDSVNRGNFIELVNLIAQYDLRLANHLEKSSVFSGLSNHIQNDLIECIASVLMESIKSELQEAPFASIQVDETTDIRCTSQVSIVLRYVNNDCIVESFWGFFDASADRSAKGLSEIILRELLTLAVGDKLIAQTYDGAAVMSSGQRGVQSIIKETYPSALFIHCYAHRLNLVLSQSAAEVPETRIFLKLWMACHPFFRILVRERRL